MRKIQSGQYKHVSLDERIIIYTLLKQGESVRDIARTLDRNAGTISRELKRNKTRPYIPYFPTTANEKAIKKAVSQRTKAPLKDPETYLYVRKKLREEDWSPQLIAGRIKRDKPHLSICHETIYQYIYGKGKRHKLWKYLEQAHRKRRVKTGRGVHKDKPVSRIPGAVSIDSRPKRAESRRQAGHFETDLMEGKRSHKAALSVTVERKTRHISLGKVRNKTATEKQKVLTLQLKQLQSLEKANKPIVRTMTADNGSENTNHREVTREVGVAFFFAHPYHSWEKGSVENSIKRIRRYIPKGSSVKMLTIQQIRWVENRINNRPMECLDYQTPNEVMEKEVNRYKFRRFKSSKETSVALQRRT